MPATRVNVSVELSATTLLCPETAIVVNESEAAEPDKSVPGTKLVPSHFNTCPLVGAFVVISTSDKSPILAKAIRASALALV